MKFNAIYFSLITIFFFLSCQTSEDIEDFEITTESLEVKKVKTLQNSSEKKVNSDVTVTFTRNANTYWYNDFISDFGNVSGYSNAEKGRHKITNSNTLSVKLLKNQVGQAGGAICDISIEKGIGYSMEYKVKFQEGFEWTKGGKLPGIGGGKVYAGGSDVSAGDGWFSRPV
jgi:hypothetical protein